MDLAKYTGTVTEGEHIARITQVAAEETKAKDGYNLVFHADFPSLELTNRIWRRSLKASALAMLRDDLVAADAIREGDAYPDPEVGGLNAAAELAEIIQNDLGDRFVRVRVKPSKQAGFQDYKIVGVEYEAA